MDERIKKLADKQIYFGTSSWKYGGWAGLIYHRSYSSEKQFQEQCLAEYAEHYPTVGVDHTYYAWPLPTTMEKYNAQTPEHFKFGLKVTEEVTVFKYPKLKRYGKRAGLQNESFLNAEIFQERFLEPLAPIKDKLGPLMLEFSQFHPGMLSSGSEFVERLDRFFTEVGTIPGIQLSVEMRNANWLKPPYFQMLAKHNVAHVHNSWTKMPILEDQLALSRGSALPAIVGRLLLMPGTKYEEAVEAFSPYDRIQDAQPAIRDGGAALARFAMQAGIPAYVFVNNRAEGCAPKTIEGILELLK